MSVLDEQASAYLRGPEFDRLWAAARRTLERNGGALDGRAAAFSDASEAEVRQWSRLLGGRPLPPGRTRIRLDRLDAALQRSQLGIGLREWLVELGGPLRDLPQARLQREEQALALTRLFAASALAAEPLYEQWFASLQAEGLLRRLSPGGEERLLRRALSVLDLVVSGEAESWSLARLAAETCGSAKALDQSQPLATVVQRALALQQGMPVPRNAAQRRELWASAGVICDPLSSRVLLLNVQAVGLSALDRRLRLAVGEPQVLTFRELSRAEMLPARRAVFICENPSVVQEAAERFGERASCLVATEGQPSGAVTALLDRLHAAGCGLHYHGDFDWPGVRMATRMIERYGASPWRFDAEHYRKAATAALGYERLSGLPRPTPWEPALRGAMEAAGVVLHEEGLVGEQLLADLGV